MKSIKFNFESDKDYQEFLEGVREDNKEYPDETVIDESDPENISIVIKEIQEDKKPDGDGDDD